ncbi:MFS transporter [Agromyces sp. NPDC058136]|uniref:MFS transporter n=1 Tax=Agromyces sp. NPDC058136 TaxID=3346354 RepID=UPI0036D81104
MIALRLLAGVGEAAFFVAGFAALADLAPEERLGEALSYNSLGLYLGIALGPPIGEALIGRGGYPLAWAGAAVLAVLSAGLVFLVGETRVTTSGSAADHHLIHRPALPITLGFLTSLVAMGGFLAFASLHSIRVGLENASLALFVYGGVVVVCRIAFAKVPDRVPSLALGAAALVTIGLGLAIAATWSTPAGLVIGAGVTAVGVAFSTPAFFAAIFATASPSQRGVASGTASAAIDLGLGIGPIILGVVADAAGIPWAFGVGAAIAGRGCTLDARPPASREDVGSGRRLRRSRPGAGTGTSRITVAHRGAIALRRVGVCRAVPSDTLVRCPQRLPSTQTPPTATAATCFPATGRPAAAR